MNPTLNNCNNDDDDDIYMLMMNVITDHYRSLADCT